MPRTIPTPRRTPRSTLRLILAATTLLVPLAAATTATASPTTTLTVQWPTNTVTRGTPLTATGTVDTATDVTLQRSVPGGWTDVKHATVTDHTFTVKIPTSFYGTFTYRLATAATDTSPAEVSKTSTLTVDPDYAPAGRAASRKFLWNPIVRWNPCRAITYRVNTTQAPAGALDDVKGALRRITYATGIKFTYLGATRIIPQGRSQETYGKARLVIAWAKASQSHLFDPYPDAAGVGGAEAASGVVDPNGNNVMGLYTGRLVVNTKYNDLTGGFGNTQTRGMLLLHEMGHVMGLDHVTDDTQVMYPSIQSRRAEYGRGDLAGLSRLGAAQGCLSPATQRSATRPTTTLFATP